MSLTDTERLQVDVLPQSSVARYERVYTTGQVPTVVSPIRVTVTDASHASLAVTIGQAGTAGQSIVMLFAQVMVGAVISRTVMVALQVDVLPQSSVALQIRV